MTAVAFRLRACALRVTRHAGTHLPACEEEGRDVELRPALDESIPEQWDGRTPGRAEPDVDATRDEACASILSKSIT
jgi:hypothetical protein